MDHNRIASFRPKDKLSLIYSKVLWQCSAVRGGGGDVIF